MAPRIYECPLIERRARCRSGGQNGEAVLEVLARWEARSVGLSGTTLEAS